ncbi:MAG TPA: response regulator [Cyanobacteria bacterium UBA8530]|nr:response regulator [Cyanobacteria bacterium UBA8530]
MSTTSPDPFLEELKRTLANEDEIKAQVLISCLGELDGKNLLRALKELSECRTPFSLGLLEQAIDLLEEKEPLESAPALVQILAGETEPNLLRKTIRSLGRTGLAGPLKEYLYSGREELVKAAIEALANIGSPEAIEPLFLRLGSSIDIDIAILDALAASGKGTEHLNQTLRSHHAAVRGRAKSHLIKLGPAALPLLLQNLFDPAPDFLIHTLNALGEIGDQSAVKPIRKLLQKEPGDPNVRFAAYETLGMIPLAHEAYALAEGLSDPVPHVRLAAARAIEKNFGKVLALGIENLLEDPEEAEKITLAFLDSQCDRVFESLLSHESFRKPAFSYLRGEAHPDVAAHFARLLREKGFSNWAEETERNDVLPSPRFSILAVDDSRMILNIYKTTLFQLGHRAELFEFPERALERLKEEKPDLLITDLNMPGLNGIEVTRLARSMYDKARLPILMVTTQNDLEDRSEAHAAGVDAILLKPFTKESLKEMIDGLLEGRTHGRRTS